MKTKRSAVRLPLTHALAWIVASTLLISGSSFALFKRYLKQQVRSNDPALALRSIIQTGPQKEALKTEYLAELIGISADRPYNAKRFNCKTAQKRLLSSPLIARAEVKIIKPNSLYIDYTIRQPAAWLEDFENVVVDKEGHPFPFSPFFAPKNLPSIYLGLAAPGMPAVDPDRAPIRWGVPLQGKYFALARDILSIVTDPQVSDLFSVKRIDVSNAFAESSGIREIVVVVEDVLFERSQGKDIEITLPRILRLSNKNYPQELGNYLKLRQQLLAEERKACAQLQPTSHTMRLKEKIIDFRIEKLAFIEE